MDTKVYEIKNLREDYPAIEEAAHLIRRGQVVAFPTETVYGLGANALDGQAVKRIFKAKGRPNDNPLIVHISKSEYIRHLALNIPKEAHFLMEEFWPGPLTLILEKSPKVPFETTAGLATVAVRMPKNPIALALIENAGLPLAAPSANSSGKPSPTTAQHVIDDLSGVIPMILDGIYPCEIGLESTVLDMSGKKPLILRPGAITPNMLGKVLGSVGVDDTALAPPDSSHTPKSPGVKYTHYSPKAQVVLFKTSNLVKMATEIKKAYDTYIKAGSKAGILGTEETLKYYGHRHMISLGSRKNPSSIAAGLYAALREFDRTSMDIILAEWVDEGEESLAIMNRLVRAAGFNIIDVNS